MHTKLLGSLGAALALGVGQASAALYPLNLPFETLELTNGKTIRAGTVRSFDDTKETVTVFTAKGAFVVPLLQLPADWTARVRAKVALQPKVAKPAAVKSPAPEPKEPVKTPPAAVPPPVNPSPDGAEPAKPAPPRTPLTPEQMHQKLMDLIRSTATEMAIGRFGEGRFELYAIEDVPGWSHQYRIRGKALKYRRAGSSVTIDRDFDYTFEAKPGEMPHLLDEQVH